jgi:DNA-binding FadR family transcriptional regulator
MVASMNISPDSAFQLKEELLSRLRKQLWRAGEQLPAERQLSERYGVSRAVVRRVLQELKQAGLIRQAVGSGTFVADDFLSRLPVVPAELPLNISPAELMEARLIFEPALIDLVIRNGTAADFANMETCCREAEAATTLEQFEHWDGAFHKCIAEASRNHFLIRVFDLMNEVRECAEWGILKKQSVNPERRAIYQEEHRALANALKMRDAEKAKQVLHGHLVNVRRNMLNY